MTGHQAAFWHPGILAKYLAADAACHECLSRGLSAAPAWVVADQDANDPHRIPYPSRPDSSTLRRAIFSFPLQTDDALHPSTTRRIAACCLPALAAPNESPPADADNSAIAGLQHIAMEVVRSSDSANAAEHVWSVVQADLRALGLNAPTLFASRLSRTRLFAEFIEAIGQDARACISAYNAAALSHPNAGIAPLSVQDDRVELPLWRLRFGQPRERVHADELPSVPMDELAPRALVFSSLMRLAGADMFIHGFGGGGYDRVTESWIGAWLPAERLSPTAIVSATRFLHFPGAPPLIPPSMADRAVWKAHRARHDPSLVNDDSAAAHKNELLGKITLAKRGNPSLAREQYKAMHELLARVRLAHSQRLAELDLAASEMRQHRDVMKVRFARDWPCAMYPTDVLVSLQREIRRHFDT